MNWDDEVAADDEQLKLFLFGHIFDDPKYRGQHLPIAPPPLVKQPQGGVVSWEFAAARILANMRDAGGNDAVNASIVEAKLALYISACWPESNWVVSSWRRQS